jgi:hypothetical protein
MEEAVIRHMAFTRYTRLISPGSDNPEVPMYKNLNGFIIVYSIR